MYFYIPAYLFCTLHTRSHLIRDSTVLIRFYIPHRFTFVLFYTRYIFTSSRILYLVSSVERSHTVLYSYFDILHPPYSRGINIFPRIVYVSCFTHFRGCDFYYFFFTLSPFPFFINLRSFFHPCDPISHIQRPSSFCKIPLGRICWNILGSEISQLSWNNKKSPGPKAALIPPALRGCSHPLPLPVFDTIEHLIRWNSGRRSM